MMTLPARPHPVLPIGLFLLLAACDGGGGKTKDHGGVAEADALVGVNDAGTGAADADAGLDAAPPPAPEGPTINSIIPNRGPLAGGTRVLVIGDGFTPTTVIHLGADTCTDVEFESANHVRCTTPAHEMPEPVNVTVRWADGGDPAELEGGFTYFQPVEITQIAPTRATIRGGVDVTIDGHGFVEPSEVRFGPNRSLHVEVQSADRIVARAPAGNPGVVDVRVINVNGEAALPQSFTYTESLSVAGLDPLWGPTTGGTEVILSGSGLVDGSAVSFGGNPATNVTSELNRERLRVHTPPGVPGTVPVEVHNVNGDWRQDDAFLYVDPAADAFAVAGAVPRRVPTQGGVPFLVGGGGFTAETTVQIDGEPVPCQLTSPQLLTCTAPPHDRGPVEVVVTQGADHADVPGGLTYYERLQLFDVRPGRGAVAGGTVVQVRGEGLTPDTTLLLDGQPMTIVEVQDGGREATAVTPPGQSGVVALQGQSADDAVLLPDAYEYFDPISGYGGVWGDPIAGAVNVTVLDALSGDALPESTVLAIPLDGSERLLGVTDAHGQVTLSRLDLAGPLNVTAAHTDYEVYTIERVTAENVTVFLYPQMPPEGGGGGGGDPIPPARLTGTVTGLEKLDKPAEPDYVLAAFVDTTHTSPFNRRSLPWPEPHGILYENGDFEVFARPGELAVVVTAAYVRRADLQAYTEGRLGYWDMRANVIPKAMGVRRFISVSPGESAENLEIDINHRLDLDVPVTLGNPSGGVPGAPDHYEVTALLDFGAEGYWELDSKADGPTAQLHVQYLPDLEAGWDPDIVYQWIGEANTQTGAGYPYAMAFQEVRDVRNGVTIGPFVGTPEPVHPTDMGTLDGDRTISWTVQPGVTGPTEPAQVNLIQITDSRGLPLWTYVTPGPVTQYTLPVLPDEIVPGGLSPDQPMYMTIVPMILDREFHFDDFTLDDLGFWNRKSFAVTSVEFTE
jgi:hypothetical protein